MLPIGNSTMDIIKFVPGTLIDDFFTFGFIGGLVGYAYYIFSTREMKNHLISFWAVLYGILISGMLGGLLAIVFDRSLELSILVGLFNQILFLTITKAVARGEFWAVMRELLIKLLTAGTGGKK